MRICCPVPGIVPGYTMTGATTYDRNILRQLALLGVECDIILPDGRILVDHEVEGWTIHMVRIPCRPAIAHHVARIARFHHTVYSVYKRHNFDLLRVHSFFSSSLEMLWTKIRYKLPVPVVVHYHHLDNHPLRKLIVQAAMYHCQAVITFSHAAKQDAVKHLGISPQKIHVVYHGIERRFRPAQVNMQLSRQLGCTPDERILLFLGNLEARKNPLFLLDVLTDLLAVKRKVKLVLAGTGPLLGVIRQKIAQLGLQNNVVLTGAIPEQLKPDYYNLADIFVFPSALEGFGLVIGEAMSCGKPVVAFNTSAMPEVVKDGVAGFLVSPSNKAEFVQRTLLLLDDKELRLEMGVQAMERVERLFRWDRAASETLKIYQQTIERFRSGAR